MAHEEFRHLGGGRKGVFLLLRYVFIIAACYLILVHAPKEGLGPMQGLMIAAALGSNVVLGFIAPETLFAWYIEAPIITADTLWVSWALQSTGAIGGDFFLLYVFVLFLAATGGNLVMVGLGSILVSAANLYFVQQTVALTSPVMLRVAFFFSVALFYGHVVTETRQERLRADKGFEWARSLEAKVAERTAELRRLYEEAQAASRAKSEFVANMSHELRTPLHIIIGYADILRDAETRTRGGEQDQAIRRIREAAAGLLHLVDGVLEIGKLDAGRVEVNHEVVALPNFLEGLRQEERLPLAPGVELGWDIEAGLPPIETDVAKLAIILNNLVNNAIKFTRAGRIVVRVRRSADAATFTVEDTGPGIAPTQLQTIFEPFQQGEGVTKGPYGGVGLGLAIVKGQAALIGADVNVESQVGHGTRFTVTVPLTPRRVRRAAA
ncbi:MAG: HAMP domain-containing sensor histidine kinase [Candidatus Binatia bacterium]